jgi:VWFA-related protein
VLGVALNAHAQQPAFRSGVELVRIPVNVAAVDATTAVGQLAAGDFSITEDGVAQEVAVFEHESLPISLCIVLDVSESMGQSTVARLTTNALRHIVNSLADEDEVAVVTFAADTSVAVPWTAAAVARKLSLTFTNRGGTAIIDGVRAALRQIDKSRGRRPIILVITDGGENSSRTSMSRVDTAAERDAGVCLEDRPTAAAEDEDRP